MGQSYDTTGATNPFLGLANYGRNFVKNLGKLLGPLYSKATPHGERKFNEEDKKLVRKV